jgi:hypothetical protein
MQAPGRPRAGPGRQGETGDRGRPRHTPLHCRADDNTYQVCTLHTAHCKLQTGNWKLDNNTQPQGLFSRLPLPPRFACRI